MPEPSQAARVILGSSLLAVARTHDKLRVSPASSGSAIIDEMALDGGFRYGEISSVAGINGTGKTLVSLYPDPVIRQNTFQYGSSIHIVEM